MQVRMRGARTIYPDGVTPKRLVDGETCELPDALAASLIAGDLAEAYAAEAKAMPPPENKGLRGRPRK